MNYLVWLRGLRGPEAQLHLNNPHQSIHWDEMKDRVIGVITLKEHERDYTLTQAIAAYPCPTGA